MENLCYGCFKNSDGDVCSACGYKKGESLEKYPMALPDGSVLDGKYIVGRVLGQGGFGITYAAMEYKTKRKVAIKEFFPDSLVVRRDRVSVSTISIDRDDSFKYGKECFVNEAQTLAQFNDSGNIVNIYSFFEENNTAYYTMEYLEGESLLAYLRKNKTLSWEKTYEIASAVMDALEYVHSKGIVHRDVSPDNIFITSSGKVKLIDFGAARYSLGDRSKSLDIILKHGFAPPEQYARHGRQGPYTDIYALAATMYRMLTGEVPPESIDRMYEDALALPSTLGIQIPIPAEKALIKALAVRYQNRFQTVAEFREAINSRADYNNNADQNMNGAYYQNNYYSNQPPQRMCPRCGQALDPSTHFCVRCGFRFDYDINNNQQQANNYYSNPPYTPGYYVKPKIPGRGFGITSLVLGIIAAFYSLFAFSGSAPFVLFCAIPGLIFAIVSLEKGYISKKTVAGFILNIIAIIISFFALMVS